MSESPRPDQADRSNDYIALQHILEDRSPDDTKDGTLVGEITGDIQKLIGAIGLKMTKTFELIVLDYHFRLLYFSRKEIEVVIYKNSSKPCVVTLFPAARPMVTACVYV